MKVFQESQKMIKPFLLIILLISFGAVLFTIIQNWKNLSEGTTSEQLGASIGLIIILAVSFLLFKANLKTKIDEKGIEYQFYPFQLNSQVISWGEIENCYLRKYKAILEFGGWGYRINLTRQNGRAYTTKGKIGLQLKLKNGKKILIGTQKKEELQRTLDNYKDKINNK